MRVPHRRYRFRSRDTTTLSARPGADDKSLWGFSGSTISIESTTYSYVRVPTDRRIVSPGAITFSLAEEGIPVCRNHDVACDGRQWRPGHVSCAELQRTFFNALKNDHRQTDSRHFELAEDVASCKSFASSLGCDRTVCSNFCGWCPPVSTNTLLQRASDLMFARL
jgi:hypothetical protein